MCDQVKEVGSGWSFDPSTSSLYELVTTLENCGPEGNVGGEDRLMRTTL
jgi:hypothetical protein